MAASKEKKSIGQVFTPDYIVSSMLDEIGYIVGNNIAEKHIIDNSCGNGAFLAQIVKRYIIDAVNRGESSSSIQSHLETYIHGIDNDSVAVHDCRERLSLLAATYGFDNINWNIIHADTLSLSNYEETMDFVVGNPPYVRVHNLEDAYKAVKRFKFAEGGMTDLYLVFYEIGLHMLSPHGRLCYITPSSWLNSVAGRPMRQCIVGSQHLISITDMGHFQPFDGITTYTMIVLFDKAKQTEKFNYYTFDSQSHNRSFVGHLSYRDCYIDGCLYLASPNVLVTLKEVKTRAWKKYVSVKNGFATLADKCFIGDHIPETSITIPIIKGSTAQWTKALFPYNRNGDPIRWSELKTDSVAVAHFESVKKILLKDQPEHEEWYLYGRTQALRDVWKDKLSLNALVRRPSDIKIEEVSAGKGIYSGLYIIGDIDKETALGILASEAFIDYVKGLKKYKSGGYYTFNSKDVEQYLNYQLNRIYHYGQPRFHQQNIEFL